MRLSRSTSLLSLLMPLVLGCTTVGPDYKAPERELPGSWREQGGRGLASRPTEPNAWWNHLGDPILDDLVERATRQGLDRKEALARIREARALRGVAAAAQLPTLDAEVTYQRRGESDNTPLGTYVPDWDQNRIGFDASWEVDLWGRVRRSVEAADADVAASVEDVRDVAVSVAAETAVNYVRFREYQRRLLLARSNVALQEQTLALVQGRNESGLVGERDVAQAATNLQSTRARVPPLEAGMRVAENRLAVLLGLTPGALAAELGAARPIPVAPLDIAVGVPADLLRRRPDIRRAERVLAAETARIGVAEGDLYPRLSLLGTVGLEADDAANLFQGSSTAFSFGPSLRWNVFDAGRLRNRVDAQDARTEQARVRWERTVLVALEEVENAMTSFVREQARRVSLEAAAVQGRRAAELARNQYREGLSDFQAVLDSERTLTDVEDELARSVASIATDAVALYKALGGGWERLDSTPPARS